MADAVNKKILLFNPPGKILIRGEARSDSETDPDKSLAAAKWIYPPMNLAYGAACLRKNNFDVRSHLLQSSPY